jgi:dTDP-glucose pyrophosphorylase
MPNHSTPKSEAWRKALLPADSALKEAIQNLTETSLQMVLVVEPDGTLVGTLTDGDIRRGLLRGLDLNSSIATLVFRSPIVAPLQLGRDTALQLMQANKIHQLPIVDENQQVVGLHLLDDLITPCDRSNLMVIMAGGQGTRLRPHTDNCPKPMLPVDGKPILEHIIMRAKAEGFQHFVLAVHYLGNMIEEYFGDGSRLQVNIDYLREEKPLGTAGAIGLMNPRPENPFLVTNGDILTDINYGKMLDFHSHHGAKIATMAVRMYEWEHPFGVVYTKGIDIVRFEEKPVARNYVNAGVYVLESKALDALVVGEYCDMPTLFNRLQEKSERTIVYPIHENWMDVGQAEDYSALIDE